MKNKYLLLILPISILIFGGISIYYFLATTSQLISVYFAILCVVSIFTAKQSIFIQSTLFYDISDLNEKDKNLLALSIIMDYGYFLLLYGAIATILYFGVTWLFAAI